MSAPAGSARQRTEPAPAPATMDAVDAVDAAEGVDTVKCADTPLGNMPPVAEDGGSSTPAEPRAPPADAAADEPPAETHGGDADGPVNAADLATDAADAPRSPGQEKVAASEGSAAAAAVADSTAVEPASAGATPARSAASTPPTGGRPPRPLLNADTVPSLPNLNLRLHLPPVGFAAQHAGCVAGALAEMDGAAPPPQRTVVVDGEVITFFLLAQLPPYRRPQDDAENLLASLSIGIDVVPLGGAAVGPIAADHIENGHAGADAADGAAAANGLRPGGERGRRTVVSVDSRESHHGVASLLHSAAVSNTPQGTDGSAAVAAAAATLAGADGLRGPTFYVLRNGWIAYPLHAKIAVPAIEEGSEDTALSLVVSVTQRIDASDEGLALAGGSGADGAAGSTASAAAPPSPLSEFHAKMERLPVRPHDVEPQTITIDSIVGHMHRRALGRAAAATAHHVRDSVGGGAGGRAATVYRRCLARSLIAVTPVAVALETVVMADRRALLAVQITNRLWEAVRAAQKLQATQPTADVAGARPGMGPRLPSHHRAHLHGPVPNGSAAGTAVVSPVTPLASLTPPPNIPAPASAPPVALKPGVGPAAPVGERPAGAPQTAVTPPPTQPPPLLAPPVTAPVPQAPSPSTSPSPTLNLFASAFGERTNALRQRASNLTASVSQALSGPKKGAAKTASSTTVVSRGPSLTTAELPVAPAAPASATTPGLATAPAAASAVTPTASPAAVRVGGRPPVAEPPGRLTTSFLGNTDWLRAAAPATAQSLETDTSLRPEVVAEGRADGAVGRRRGDGGSGLTSAPQRDARGATGQGRSRRFAWWTCSSDWARPKSTAARASIWTPSSKCTCTWCAGVHRRMRKSCVWGRLMIGSLSFRAHGDDAGHRARSGAGACRERRGGGESAAALRPPAQRPAGPRQAVRGHGDGAPGAGGPRHPRRRRGRVARPALVRVPLPAGRGAAVWRCQRPARLHHHQRLRCAGRPDGSRVCGPAAR